MYTKEQVCEMGERIYTEKLREIVETPENIGKIILIEVQSGDYVVAATSIQASQLLREKHPEGEFCALRIGYLAVETIGGVLPKRKQVA
jgi:hypothetical protein